MMAVAEFRQVLAGPSGQGRWADALSRIFEPQGIVVRRAPTRPETVSIVEHEPVAVAGLGVEQPRMDGLSVLRIIRNLDAALPCVLVSRQASRPLMEQALGLGAYSVLADPVDVDIMAGVMRDIFYKFYGFDLKV